MKSTLIALSLAGSLALFAGCGGEEKEASGGSVTTPQVDANTLARAKGKSVFKKTCVACHGDDGRGIAPMMYLSSSSRSAAPSMTPPTPPACSCHQRAATHR